MAAGELSLGTPRTKASRRQAKSHLLILGIMEHLDSKKQRMIEEQINNTGGVVDLPNFVKLLSEQLYPDSTDQDLKNGLCDLFSSIDINGDGTLEWHEFTAFVVEKAKIYAESDTALGVPPFTEVRPKSQDKKARTNLFASEISQVYFIAALDVLISFRQGSAIVAIADVVDGSHLATFSNKVR